MEVRFCDLCNESVPQIDLDQGRAKTIKGRIVCATCDRAMSHMGERSFASPAGGGHAIPSAPQRHDVAHGSHVNSGGADAGAFDSGRRTNEVASSAHGHGGAHFGERAAVSIAPPPAPPRNAASSAGLWVAVVGLLFTAGTIAVFNDRIRTLDLNDRALAERDKTLASSLARVDAVPGQLAASETRVEERLRAELARDREGLTQDLAELGKRLQTSRDEITRLASELAALKSESVTGASSWQKRVEDVAQRLARQEDDFRVQAERIAELEEIAKNPPVVAVDSAAAPGGAPAAPATAAWKAAIPDLTSTNQNQRWMAVDAIGHSGDPEAVPYLVPMLKDADVFVRMAAARVLGDMKALAAVPALIDALEDADTPVRDAAWTAFSSIAGTHLQFDAGANEAERARRIKAIREWWKKAEEEASKK